MFTSRAEFRLSLRADNADQRLTPIGLDLGCVGESRKSAFLDKMERLEAARVRLTGQDYTPKQVAAAGIRVNQDGTRRTGLDVLAFPEVGFGDLLALDPSLADVDAESRRQMEREALYANYIARQEKDIEALRRDENRAIPADFDFAAIEGLSNELKAKLTQARPASLAQAARLDGMTPAALALLLAWLRRNGEARRA